MCVGTPKTRTEFTPLSWILEAIPSYPLSGWVGTPGMESVYFVSPMFASKNMGSMSSSGWTRVSQTRSLIL